MKTILLGLPFIFCSCANINEGNNYGFSPGPGMSEDAQDKSNTKYNLMDSSDGQNDPNALINIWKTEF